jgi:hypothetical protein
MLATWCWKDMRDWPEGKRTGEQDELKEVCKEAGSKQERRRFACQNCLLP